MISLSLDNLRGTSELPLYYRYPNQIFPQPASVQMDEDGDVIATYSAEVGNAVSSEIWHKKLSAGMLILRLLVMFWLIFWNLRRLESYSREFMMATQLSGKTEIKSASSMKMQ